MSHLGKSAQWLVESLVIYSAEKQAAYRWLSWNQEQGIAMQIYYWFRDEEEYKLLCSTRQFD
jgi:hypothetical protein